MRNYELQPSNSQKSFYGKAVVTTFDSGAEILRSYSTDIIIRKGGQLFRIWDGWSATTGKHIRSFCGLNKAEYFRLPECPERDPRLMEMMEEVKPHIVKKSA